VPMLAELIDAVVGVDTHRDTHEVEIALPTGTAIGTRKISNDNSGFAELLAWIVDNAPGPRVVVSIEGTRSFGVGLARAVAAAGLTVIECEQPNRKARVHPHLLPDHGHLSLGVNSFGLLLDDLLTIASA
jgi:transposase